MMAAAPLHVQMLGGFSICLEGQSVSISDRSRKLCLLLAYLIQNRDRPVSYRELSDLLWHGSEQGAGSLNTLKAILHRARSCLDQLGEKAGRTLLLSREGCYQWNPDFPLTLDTEEFTQLCQAGAEAREEADRLSLWRSALDRFQGEFLPSLSDQPWAAAQSEQLHQRYFLTLLDTLPLLANQDQWTELARLAGTGLALEPFREDLCRWRLEALIRLDQRQEAVQLYEEFHQRLLSQSGVLPSEPLRQLYQQARRDQDPRAISSVTLLEQLQEAPQAGPFFCEYDFFRAICRSVARMAERTSTPVHIALLSLSGSETPLARYSLDRAMDNLEELIRARLRRGDAFSRCSASQFVLLLPQASYENGRMVCSRITRAFNRQYPHSPALLQFSVQSLLASPSTR